MEVQTLIDWLPMAYVPERGQDIKTIDWIGYDQ